MNDRRVIGVGAVFACLALALAPLSPVQAAQAVDAKDAANAAYAVAARSGGQVEGAMPTFDADNPANNLRLEFNGEGLKGSSLAAGANAWSFDLVPVRGGVVGAVKPLVTPEVTASGNRVEYVFGNIGIRYTNTKEGLEQVIRILAPTEGDAKATGDFALDLSLRGDVVPVRAAYFVDLVLPDGKTAVRYGAFHASDANGKKLEGGVDVLASANGKRAGVRISVEAANAAYPIEITTVIRAKATLDAVESASPAGEIVGKPVEAGKGITESVEQIAAREAALPEMLRRPFITHPEMEYEPELRENPEAPAVSQWPPSDQLTSSPVPAPLSPQTVGTSFLGISLNPPSFNESGNIPPDTMGDVGPTQILVASNGRLKLFDKAGNVGALNVSDATFWASVTPTTGVSDPQVRYDRLSGRWFVLAIDLANTNNKLLLAVSSGSTITSQSSFTFFSVPILTAISGEAGFCDYPGLGIDANALYGGCNIFSQGNGGTYQHSSAYVIRKSSVLGAGPMVITGFLNVTGGSTAGPWAPRGVDNDDPSATEGYIVGSDIATASRIVVRRVSTPGGTPTLSANLNVTLPTNGTMSNQCANGSCTAGAADNRINGSDSRLFAAGIHKNKITGVSSLWTAQQVETDGSGVYTATTTVQRIGARYYEIGNLTTTPSLTQSGTLFTAGTSTIQNNLRGFIYPTVALSGQGHMSLGASYGSSTEFMGVAVAGRLRTDTAGTIQSPTLAVTGLGSYILCDGTSNACPRNRWGDYSFTDVDPNDDQTVWTFQEYALDPTGTGFTGNWGVRAVQLKAPPPATPSSASPSICSNRSSLSVVVTGTSSSGSEFFDPGSDPGGPGYLNHISATVSGGVTVNSVTFTDPTHVTLSLNTTNAAAGTKNVTITNPDGQSATASNLITLTVCNPGTIQGTIIDSATSSPISGATVTAGGNSTTTNGSGFYQLSNISDGSYTVTASAPGYFSNAALGVTVTSGQTTTQDLALAPNTGGCAVDTSQPDFQAGVATNLDLTTSPGDVKLAKQ